MWKIVPREPDLSRLYDPLSNWTNLLLFERHNEPDTWTVTGPLSEMEMFDEGAGCILFSDADQVTSGELIDLEAFTETTPDGRMQETMKATFGSDLIILGDRHILPSPTYAMPTGTVFNFPDAYNSYIGTVEGLILTYIRAHMGDLGVVDRRVPRLRIPASLGRGGNTSVTARFDNLGTLVASLAESGNLRVRIVHTEDVNGAWLDVTIESVSDLSADIRFGTTAYTGAGRILDWRWRKRRPTATRVLTLGGGQLAARDMLLLKHAASEASWNRVIETTIDQRQVDPADVNKLTELTRAGQEALDEGAGLVEVSFTPRLGSGVKIRRDLKLGDIVGYDLPRLPPAKDKIRQIRTEVTVQSNQPTENVKITVGTPSAPEDPVGGQTDRVLREINALSRSE